MGGDRVLSTSAAKEAIKKLQGIINSGTLDSAIKDMNTQGTTLSQPGNWDGRLAKSFRESWPDTNRKLVALQKELEELRGKIQTINANIMSAGGNE